MRPELSAQLQGTDLRLRGRTDKRPVAPGDSQWGGIARDSKAETVRNPELKDDPRERLDGDNTVLTFSFLWLLVFFTEQLHLLRGFSCFTEEPLEARREQVRSGAIPGALTGRSWVLLPRMNWGSAEGRGLLQFGSQRQERALG